MHALRDDGAHLLELVASGRPIDLAHYRAANRSLADEHREVRRDAYRRNLVEKRRDGNGRAAIRAFDQRRYALPHVVVGGRHFEDAAPRVGMNVDETWRDYQSLD